MNIKDNTPTTPKVTTGPLPASTKIYSSPPKWQGEGHENLKVPFREITLTGDEPNLRVYDPSGPYGEEGYVADVEQGLARLRTDWIMARGGVELYDGRTIQKIMATPPAIAWPVLSRLKTNHCAPRTGPWSPSMNLPRPGSLPMK